MNFKKRNAFYLIILLIVSGFLVFAGCPSGLAVAASSGTIVTSQTYLVLYLGSAYGVNIGYITNVPYETLKATFEAALTKGQADQIWNDDQISNPVENGDTLVVTAQDGTTATYTVAVNPGTHTTPASVPVTGVILNEHTANLIVGDTDQLTATVSPSDATNQNVTWSSSDSNIATVDNNGKVTAVSVGSDTITVTTADGGYTDTDSLIINSEAPVSTGQSLLETTTPETAPVTAPGLEQTTSPTTSALTTPASVPVTGVTLNEHTANLTVGDTDQLTATVSPSDATNQNVTWSSSDSNIATVDNNGKVTAVSVGSDTITVTTADGGYTDTDSLIINSEAPVSTGQSLLETTTPETAPVTAPGLEQTTSPTAPVATANISDGKNRRSFVLSIIHVLGLFGRQVQSFLGHLKF